MLRRSTPPPAWWNSVERQYKSAKTPINTHSCRVYLDGGPSAVSSALKTHYSSTAERWKAFQKAGVDIGSYPTNFSSNFATEPVEVPTPLDRSFLPTITVFAWFFRS